MARKDLWTRDQLLLALRLYMRFPFGKLHRLNPEIIELANQLGRTPNAMAMKACNFANLDPALQARGIRGLSNLSNADREIWKEFLDNAEALAAEAEEAAARIAGVEELTVPEFRIPPGPTDIERLVRARRVQSFFRSAVLTTYASTCAVSGIEGAELLTASHIIPWRDSVARRADPRNGICLNALLDRAFDRGFFTFDDHLRVIVSRRLAIGLTDARLKCSLDQIDGIALQMPTRFLPDPEAIRFHRSHVFQTWTNRSSCAGLFKHRGNHESSANRLTYLATCERIGASRRCVSPRRSASADVCSMESSGQQAVISTRG